MASNVNRARLANDRKAYSGLADGTQNEHKSPMPGPESYSAGVGISFA